MKRRELFSSLASSFQQEDASKKLILRPPYCNDENAFDSTCKTCEGFCITACDTQHIIEFDQDHTPVLNLGKTGCTYCDDCATACTYDVLQVEQKHSIKATVSINILQCLSWNQTMCFSCKDPCLDNAIDFLAMFRPSINDNCTSCGFCMGVCPVNAIEIKGNTHEVAI
jgi:ferredoxin-type protein NapF